MMEPFELIVAFELSPAFELPLAFELTPAFELPPALAGGRRICFFVGFSQIPLIKFLKNNHTLIENLFDV